MPVILGTAGHIDHGKTTLVRALTGIDCDRLEEEKRRGITIELGFAYCDLPGGQRLGIVDVPGHERFVKNMVAGAAGIDLVMLVIAADEGVMPQTREHLEICSLLGIRSGFVALTKTDMVDEDWLGLVREDVAAFLKGTFLEGAPILPVSSATGKGMDELRAHLAQAAAALPKRADGDLLRLPADRVFTLKGHGTVVTGTIISGSIKVGDTVAFMPPGKLSRVRSLQNHGKSVESMHRGQRCAVNVQDLDVADIERGFVMAHPGTLEPASRWIVRLTSLDSAPRPLRHRTEVHFHHGSRECAARVHLLEGDRLAPGTTALAELRFSEPMTGVFGDRCVLRAYSPLRTVAGGIIVSPVSVPLRKRDPRRQEKADILASLYELGAAQTDGKTADALVEALLRLHGGEGLSLARMRLLSGLGERALEKSLQNLSSKGSAVCFDRENSFWIAAEAFARITELFLARAADFHKKNPLEAGLARGALAGAVPGLPPKLAHALIERALKKGSLVSEGDVLRLPTHRVSLCADSSELKKKLLDAHVKAGMTPPNLKDVLEQLDTDAKTAAPVLKLLCEEKALVKLKEGLYCSGSAMNEILEKVRAWFADHDNLDLPMLKEVLNGLSRKYLVAIMEYMDREKITVRVGDARHYRGRDGR